MTAYLHLSPIVVILAVFGWTGSALGQTATAEKASATVAPVTSATTASNGTSGTTHKATHRKRKKSADATDVATAKTTPTTSAEKKTAAPVTTEKTAATGVTEKKTTVTEKTASSVKTGKTARTRRKEAAEKSSTEVAKSKTKPIPAESKAPGTASSPAPATVSAPPAPTTFIAPAQIAPLPAPASASSTTTTITVEAPPATATPLLGKTSLGGESPSVSPLRVDPPVLGPSVETGLPVARRGTSISSITTLPAATTFGVASLPSPTGTISSRSSADLGTEGNYAVSTHRGPRNVYPWKTNIITTIFWIGEGGTTISATDNIGSAWDEDWRHTNGGTDTPEERSGYASGRHASLVNTFYVALPFNDLAFPDKARIWLPAGWSKPVRRGERPVSACKDRWIEIKNSEGRSCFAQWEDVGPLRYDHAEYVFGNERPTTYTRAGLDVSPAVAQFLHLDERHNITRWRFVDDDDVPPGVWLKYEEQAVLYKAIEEAGLHSSTLPIQKASTPLEDHDSIDSNKKRVGAAKG